MNAEQRALFEALFEAFWEEWHDTFCRVPMKDARSLYMRGYVDGQACLAANAIDRPADDEREREMQATIAQLQADMADAKCAIYNITPQRTVDDVKDTLDEQIGFLWPQIAGMEKRVTELETLLKRAHHPTCSMNCPSHVEISEGYGHSPLCRKITAALKKGPSDD